MSSISRRQFLATTGTAIGAVTGLTASTGSVAAEHLEDIPDHVTIDYPEALLEQYRPRLVTYHLDFEPTALHGWRVRSPEFDTEALVFWAEYPYQDGVSPFGGVLSDSHVGDHEPCYVFLDAGEPVEYRASVYHWMAGSFYPESLRFEEDSPVLKPVNPWHQYTTSTEDPRDTPVPLENLQDSLPVWLEDEKFESSLGLGVTSVPWRMRFREHWWRRDGLSGFSLNAMVVNNLAWMSENTPADFAGYSKSATGVL